MSTKSKNFQRNKHTNYLENFVNSLTYSRIQPVFKISKQLNEKGNLESIKESIKWIKSEVIQGTFQVTFEDTYEHLTSL